MPKFYNILNDLHELQPNLSFNRSQLQEVMAKVFDQNYQQWKMEKKHKQDYVEVMTRRIKNIGRFVHQGETHERLWANDLPWVKKAKKDKAEGEKDFFFGYDTEMQLAYRTHINDKTKEKDFAKEVKPQKGKGVTAPCIATWADGMQRKVPELTCKAFMDLQQGRQGAKAGTGKDHIEGMEWTGTHPDTQHAIYLKMKPDRGFQNFFQDSKIKFQDSKIQNYQDSKIKFQDSKLSRFQLLICFTFKFQDSKFKTILM